MNKKIYTLALLSLAGLPAMAQMDNTVEVETSVTPIVKDANKINVLPEVVESQASHKDVTYSTKLLQTKKYVFTPVDIMSSVGMGSKAGKGFLSLGGGTSGNLDLKGAYGFDISRNDVLGIRMSSIGFMGSADNDDFYQADGKTKGVEFDSRFYSTRIGADYTHKYNRGLSELYVKFGLENQVFNYQGMLGRTDKAFVYDTDKQHNTMSSVKIGSTDYKSGNFRINGEFGFGFFNQKYFTNMSDKYTEANLHLGTDLGYFFSEESSLNASLGLNTSSYGMDRVSGYTDFHFAPYYKYEDYDVDLKLGLYICGDGIAPDVKVDYHASENTDLYAQVTGYDNGNGLYELGTIHPYAFLQNPAVGSKLEMHPEFHQIDGKLGVRFRSETGWSGDINLGYDKSKNRAELLRITDKAPVPYFIFTDGGRFYVNLDIAYNYDDKVKFNLKNQFNSWSVDKDQKDSIAIARPVLDLDWNVDFCFGKGFYFGVDWKLMSFKKPATDFVNLKPKNTANVYKRPVTVDFGLSAHYEFPNSPVSIFANVDNLFNCKYDRFYGYRAMGINFIAGLALTF